MSEFPCPKDVPAAKSTEVGQTTECPFGKKEEPTPQMKKLLALEGKWISDVTMYMEGKESKVTGFSISKALYNGKFLESRVTMGDLMHGRELIGYDPKSGEWHSYWIDSHSTNPVICRGKEDDKGNVNLVGTMDCCQTGNKVPVRVVYHFEKGTFQLFCQKDDKDIAVSELSLDIQYTRFEGPSHISHMTLLCKDVDATKKWYVEKLGFTLDADFKFGDKPEMRWTVIGAPEDTNHKITLAHATEINQYAVGKQTIGAPFIVLGSRDIRRDLPLLKSRGVEVTRELEDKFYGIECGIKDLDGNEINFIQVKPH
jgi:catechol 2,3-dioxygenase-like lactoylglutathione lyase family enzyme